MDDVTNLILEYCEAVARGTEQEEGWPSSAYVVSKVGVIAMTGLLKWEEEVYRGWEALSCCPGWAGLDTIGGKGRTTPEEGAELPVRLVVDGAPAEMWDGASLDGWESLLSGTQSYVSQT